MGSSDCCPSMKSHSNNRTRRCRPLLGTFVEIDAAGHEEGVESAVEEAYSVINHVQRLMSFHDPTSELNRLNLEAHRHAVQVHPSTWYVLTKACEIAAASGGAFDPTSTSALQLQNTQSRKKHAARHCGNWTSIQFLPRSQIRFNQPLQIDLGGIAKGFAVDLAVETLQRRGIRNGLVNAGGDLRVFGEELSLIHI